SRAWGEGFWSLIPFTLQMVMILVGGYVVATSPAITLLLKIVSQKIRTPTQAVVVTTIVASLASWLNWGLGLVVGAFLAVEMARNVPKTSFKLLVASAYS